MLLHADTFTHRCFFTEKFLHTGTLTRRCPSFFTQDLLRTHTPYKEKPLDTETFTVFSQENFYTEMPLQTEAFTHRSFYTEKILHREAFSQTSVCGKEPWAQTVFTYSSFHTHNLLRKPAFTVRLVFTEQRFVEQLLHTEALTLRGLYTEKLLHKEASKQSIFHAQKHLHTQKLYIYTQSVYTDAFMHRSLFTELTDRRFDAERPLHRAAFAHRRPQAFTHRSFYT